MGIYGYEGMYGYVWVYECMYGFISVCMGVFMVMYGGI